MDKLCKIRDLQRAVHQFESAFEKRYGICLNEGMTLCSLSKTGRLCPGELGELLGLTPSNTSKVLRSVEQKGLVTRELCNEDRRQMYYYSRNKDANCSLRSAAGRWKHPKSCATGSAGST